MRATFVGVGPTFFDEATEAAKPVGISQLGTQDDCRCVESVEREEELSFP